MFELKFFHLQISSNKSEDIYSFYNPIKVTSLADCIKGIVVVQWQLWCDKWESLLKLINESVLKKKKTQKNSVNVPCVSRGLHVLFSRAPVNLTDPYLLALILFFLVFAFQI